METILDWIKGIVILFVVLTALLQLVPKTQYKKYIRFFVEMIIVIAVIRPVTGIVYSGGSFDEKIHYSAFLQELENAKLDAGKLEFLQEDYRKEKYEAAIAQDIGGMAEGKEYEISSVRVSLSEEYELEQVDIRIQSDNESRRLKDEQELTDKIVSYYQIGEDRIHIDPEG